MLIYIRADASFQIGTGHVMRCLALADQLRKQGDTIRFLCRNHQGNLVSFIRNKGYSAYLLNDNSEDNLYSYSGKPQHEQWLGVPWQVDADQTVERLQEAEESIDWLIIDHYGLDEKYEKKLRFYVKNIMVIDDLADRQHDCDLLLDHNYYIDRETRYDGLVPSECRILTGSNFALLREEFHTARKALHQRDGSIRSLLLSFGGVDLTGETLKALRATEQLAHEGLRVKVILGKMNPNASSIIEFCGQMPNCSYYEHVDNMTKHMIEADLAIGSGGTTTWERCCLGLPSLVVTTAYNQERLSEHISQTGAIFYLGTSNEVTSQLIHDQVRRMMQNRSLCLDMSSRASTLVDGLGTKRIAKELSR